MAAEPQKSVSAATVAEKNQNAMRLEVGWDFD